MNCICTSPLDLCPLDMSAFIRLYLFCHISLYVSDSDISAWISF